MTTADPTESFEAEEAVAALDATYANVEAAEVAVEAAGESELQRLGDAYDRFTDLLEEYEVPASGSGRETFEAYIEFESALVDFIERLPADLPRRDAFEAAETVLDKRRLSTDDFDRARDELAPVIERVALLNRREAARKEYRSARHDVTDLVRSIERRLTELDQMLSYADANLDAPVEDLCDPIETYNDVIMEAFTDYLSATSSREVLRFIEVTQRYPLVAFSEPPSDLATYVQDHTVGEEPIPRLIEFADYSPSKLGHYVENPSSFRANVSGNRTYLSRLDATPLTLSWPPPVAGELTWLIRELVAVVDRFAADSVVRQLHDIRDLSRDHDRYEEMRRAAVATSTLDQRQRSQLSSGKLKEEYDRLRTKRNELNAALDRYPDR